MRREKQIGRIKELIQKAINVASEAGLSQTMSEAKAHMHMAIAKLNNASAKQAKKQVTQSMFAEQEHSPVAASPLANMSQEGHMKVLKNLDAMIDEEKNKLEKLEQEIENEGNRGPSGLLNG